MESHGELSIESAIAYFEYGNALLEKEEEKPTDNLLNNVEEEEEGDDLDNKESPNESATTKQSDVAEISAINDQVPQEFDDEPESDVQIAWESIDVRTL